MSKTDLLLLCTAFSSKTHPNRNNYKEHGPAVMECDIEQNVASELRLLELVVLVHMCNKIKAKSGQRGHSYLSKTLAVWDPSPGSDRMLKNLSSLPSEQDWPCVFLLQWAVTVESSCPFFRLQGLGGFGSNWINNT